MSTALYETNMPGLKRIQQGKVRDIYAVGEHLLLVATDRLSAFDVVMPDPIPDKGKILTLISLYWFDAMKEIIPNHVVASRIDDYPPECRPYAEQIEQRSMLVRKAKPLPVECVVRGYLSGSGWSSYLQSGQVCGISLPGGLSESERLPDPIFTPSTKAPQGEHDVNITFDEMAGLIGSELAEQVRAVSLEIYRKGAETAERKGIIIADTKFEFGLLDGDLILIDEVLTPDSSRFWPKDGYRPGGAQDSFDKQYFRDYLTSIGFDKSPPGPRLPEEVIRVTRSRYLEALIRLTGSDHGLAD
ncbi:MAG: phosphoribosylaminoimidazolesuccinocarboxamide synthase [Desulfobacterales bacterium]